MSERFDAVVIGGGANGLAAAALLAKAGLRAALFEREAEFGAPADPVLRALDPHLVKTLKLTRHGLKFAVRDVPLAALRQGGAPLVLGADRHATAHSLVALSAADAAAYPIVHRELLALARALRPLWWDGRPAAQVAAALKPPQRALFEKLTVTSAACWLSVVFESAPLKAALAFAAAQCGAAPSEPGSALALAWSAAQEMSGRQGAVALPRDATFIQALSAAAKAAGAELRTGTPVARITVSGRAVAGVELYSGEKIEAPLVLCALSRHRALGELLPVGAAGLGAARALERPSEDIGCATLIFALNRLPDFAKDAKLATRFIIAERLETYETAFASARLGRNAREPVLELLVPPPVAAPASSQPAPSRIALVVRAWPVPAGFERAALVQSVTAGIERFAPGFAGTVAGCEIHVPPNPPATVARLLAGAAARIETPISGLLLCGVDAEPANAVSGRAARHAVRLALALRDRGFAP